MAVDRSQLPKLGPIPTFRFPTIVRHRLPNGLELRTVEHASIPVISMVLFVRGGLGADPPTREGLAALTADLVDEGTPDLSALEISGRLAPLPIATPTPMRPMDVRVAATARPSLTI